MALQQLAASHGMPCHYMGLVGAPNGELVIHRETRRWQWQVPKLRAIHLDAIPRRMHQAADAGKG